MKIEWLNDEMTEAIVTKGWFRKRQAHVKEQDVKVSGEFIDYTARRWCFASTGRQIGFFGEWALDAARDRVERERIEAAKKQAAQQEWQPVSPMPPARVVKT